MYALQITYIFSYFFNSYISKFIMRLFSKLLLYANLYSFVSVHITQHPFFKNSFFRGYTISYLFLIGFRRNRLVFSSSGLFNYFLKIKIFFNSVPKKPFIVVSTNELVYFLSKSLFTSTKASCVFAPRLGFLTNTSSFTSTNRISVNKIKFNSSFLIYLGHGGLINVLKESLILNLPVFALIGSMRLLNDVDYPLFGSPLSVQSAYFYCSFILFVYKFNF